MASGREGSVDADTDDEGEEEDSKDIWGGVHCAGASPATGEKDGYEVKGHGQDLPSSKAGVDNQHSWIIAFVVTNIFG